MTLITTTMATTANHVNRSHADCREIPNAAPICAQLTWRDRKRSTTVWSWFPLPCTVSSIGPSRSKKRSVGNVRGSRSSIFQAANLIDNTAVEER
jgi:hypothetical protein